ncbi:MAG: hypothetical protein JWL75_797 [Parcubacteria group bacterium]|nr:hypothetical protein [Parcubacteria group bacterium]
MQGVLFAFTTGLPHQHPAFAAVQHTAKSSARAGRFVFLDVSFQDLPHPLVMRAMQSAHPVRTLDNGWKEIDRICDAHILPALAEGKRVVASRFDFDLLVSVLHGQSDHRVRDRLKALHRSKMQEVLRAKGIPMPIYLTLHGSPDEDFSALSRAPKLRHCSDLSIASYIKQRGELIRVHFGCDEQNTPFQVNTGGGATVEQLTAQAFSYLNETASPAQSEPMDDIGIAA